MRQTTSSPSPSQAKEVNYAHYQSISQPQLSRLSGSTYQHCAPYPTRAIRPYHRLAEAYRLLAEALAQASTGQIVTVAGRLRNTILYALEAEGYPNGEVPILSWDNAQPGDLVVGPYMGGPDTGLFRVAARKLRPKWRAKRLLAHIPNAQIWIDSIVIQRDNR